MIKYMLFLYCNTYTLSLEVGDGYHCGYTVVQEAKNRDD